MFWIHCLLFSKNLNMLWCDSSPCSKILGYRCIGAFLPCMRNSFVDGADPWLESKIESCTPNDQQLSFPSLKHEHVPFILGKPHVLQDKDYPTLPISKRERKFWRNPASGSSFSLVGPRVPESSGGESPVRCPGGSPGFFLPSSSHPVPQHCH